MGCNCYDNKKHNLSNGKIKNNTIVNNALTNKDKNNKILKKKEIDKISSLSSFISNNSINTLQKSGTKSKKKTKITFNNNNNKINDIKNNKIDNLDEISIFTNDNFPPIINETKNKNNKDNDKFSITNNSINKIDKFLFDNEYIFNISKVNLNKNNNNGIERTEKKQYKFKQSQVQTIKDLINLIKNDIGEMNDNKELILFHKGNRVYESDTIYNIINKKNNEIDNLFNSNSTQNKPKTNNEIDFDMISILIDEDYNNNDDSSENYNDSFSSSENQKIIKNKKNEKNNIKKYDKNKEKTRKVLFNLTPICKNHKQEHLIYICLTCYNSFCRLDFKEHKKEFKEHELIQKNKLIDLNYDIKRIKSNLNEKYKEIIPDINDGKGATNRNTENENKLNYISSNNIFLKLKIEINELNEELENLYDSYMHSYNKMNSKFLSVYEDKMPKIIEFDEYIDKTLSNFENLNIFSNENIFIDNYNNKINIKKTSNNYYQSIISLKEIISKYKELLEIFKEKGKELIEYIKKGLDNIMKFKNGDKIFNLNGAFLQFNENTDIKKSINANTSNNNTNIKNPNNVSMTTNKEINQSINLRFLFSDKKSRLSKSVMNKNFFNNNMSNGCSSITKSKNKNFNYNIKSIKEENKDKDKDKNLFLSKSSFKNEFEDKNINKDNLNLKNEIFKPKIEIMENEKEKEIKFNEIALKSPSNISSKFNIKFDLNSFKKNSFSSSIKESDLSHNYLYSLINGTKDIIQFIPIQKKLNIITPDTSALKIKKFESYISYINYNNKFYISGGYSTSKQFFEYDFESNKFIKLPEMLSNHYYHTMIGNNNYIYSISGFKSKKIEKYNIIDKEWVSLPDLSYERSYSNTLIYNNNIFFFGKINKINDNENHNNIIEYLNLYNDNYNINNKWNQIEIDFKIPFNSGIIMVDENNILLVGGKMELNENSINTCYNMNINKKNEKYEINITQNNIKIDQGDEFNGNSFYYFDNKDMNCGLFSSINPYLFYIYNKRNNNFSCIKYNNND